MQSLLLMPIIPPSFVLFFGRLADLFTIPFLDFFIDVTRQLAALLLFLSEQAALHTDDLGFVLDHLFFEVFVDVDLPASIDQKHVILIDLIQGEEIIVDELLDYCVCVDFKLSTL